MNHLPLTTGAAEGEVVYQASCMRSSDNPIDNLTPGPGGIVRMQVSVFTRVGDGEGGYASTEETVFEATGAGAKQKLHKQMSDMTDGYLPHVHCKDPARVPHDRARTKCWINLPEEKHPVHKYHGCLVEAELDEKGPICTVYFTGKTVPGIQKSSLMGLHSMHIFKSSLTEGWPEAEVPKPVNKQTVAEHALADYVLGEERMPFSPFTEYNARLDRMSTHWRDCSIVELEVVSGFTLHLSAHGLPTQVVGFSIDGASKLEPHVFERLRGLSHIESKTGD